MRVLIAAEADINVLLNESLRSERYIAACLLMA